MDKKTHRVTKFKDIFEYRDNLYAKTTEEKLGQFKLPQILGMTPCAPDGLRFTSLLHLFSSEIIV